MAIDTVMLARLSSSFSITLDKRGIYDASFLSQVLCRLWPMQLHRSAREMAERRIGEVVDAHEAILPIEGAEQRALLPQGEEGDAFITGFAGSFDAGLHTAEIHIRRRDQRAFVIHGVPFRDVVGR